MSRTGEVLERIVFARNYTLEILETVPETGWFRMPAEGVTHVAWQVGHLAMASYRLCLERVRGVRPEDDNLISAAFLKTFGRDSVATPDPRPYPTTGEIRGVFDAVYAKVLEDLPLVPDADLDAPPRTPHKLYKTRLACLHWCSHHEMLHAGQIGLLRRLFGQKPIW